MQKMPQKTLLIIVCLFFAACGYKPSAKYARNALGESVSTTVIISQEDPENSVLVKDAIDAAIIDVFHTSLVKNKDAASHLVISVSNPVYIPIQYDANGFVVAYRMSLTLRIKRYFAGKVKSYSANGYYDFAVAPNAVVTDQQRFDAIRYAAQKAVVSFIAQVASEGARS